MTAFIAAVFVIALISGIIVLKNNHDHDRNRSILGSLLIITALAAGVYLAATYILIKGIL